MKVGSLGRKEEESAVNVLADEKEALVEGAEAKFDLRVASRESAELSIPPLKSGNPRRAELVEQTRMDPSLEGWRKLGDSGEQGFVWQDGLLFRAMTTHVLETAHLIALPITYRQRILLLAHEKLGHLGARKVKVLIKQRFTWPGMGQDVTDHSRSCPVCQQCSKAPARKNPMVEREVLSEPFEALAFDIVGPMPKGKVGYLTAICMARKWPEALPLRTITAKVIAQGQWRI